MAVGNRYETIPLVRDSPSHSQSSSSSAGSNIGSQPGRSEVCIRALIHILIFQALIFVVNHAVRQNIVLYCSEVLLYKSGASPKMIDLYDALSPALPVFGGLLADTMCRRYSVIVSGAFITLFGVFLLTLNVIPFDNVFDNTIPIEAMRGIFAFGFTFIFIGLAAYESNVDVFAARQVEAKGQNMVRTAFHFLYWSQILGTTVALPIVDYMSREYNFAIAFGILNCTMVFVIIVLMTMNKNYIYIPPIKGAFCQVLHIIVHGFIRRKEPVEDHQKAESFLDHAKDSFGGQFKDQSVEEVRHLLKTLPAFHTVTIYSIIIYFMKETYGKQMLGLSHQIPGSVNVPNITFEVYGNVCILIFTPFLWWIFHYLESIDIKVTPLRRIGIGIVFAGLSILSAGFIEYQRKRMMPVDEPIINFMANQSYNASALNSLTQLPQLTLGGLAEALVRVAGLEFAYFEAQKSLKGFVMGLYILMSGVGSYILSKILVAIVNAASKGDEWYQADINEGHLEYFFFVLVGVALLDLLYLYLISKNYVYHGWGKQGVPLLNTTGNGVTLSQTSPQQLTNSMDSSASAASSDARESSAGTS